MAMTINGQLSQGADNLTTIMNRHQTAMGKSLEKVSTGKKINHAGDDSAGNAISEKMLAQIRGLDQSQENTQSANSLLKVADAAITSIVDIVRAMKTKALEAANDSLSVEDRLAVANEINQLKDQVASSALVTHNGRYLLNGDYFHDNFVQLAVELGIVGFIAYYFPPLKTFHLAIFHGKAKIICTSNWDQIVMMAL